MLSEVKGQSEGVRYLRRVVEGRVSSPLLLVGPEGVGRRFAVLAAAKEEFSASGGSAYHVAQIVRGIHPDVITIQSEDGVKDIGIGEIRDLLETVESYPSSAPKRYVILDGADKLTDAAANALLKTLEEPPATTRFFLLAQNARSVIPTIRSRCGEIRFAPLPERFLVDFLCEHTEDAGKALVYARISNGSVGRALQYLGSGRLTLRDEMLSLLKLGLGGDLSSLFSAVGKATNLRLGLHFLEHILHDLVMLPYNANALTNQDIAQELAVLRPRLGEKRLWALVDAVHGVGHLSPSMNLAFHVKSAFATIFAE